MVYREDEQAPFDWDKFHGHEVELNVLRNSVKEILRGDEELDVLDKKTRTRCSTNFTMYMYTLQVTKST